MTNASVISVPVKTDEPGADAGVLKKERGGGVSVKISDKGGPTMTGGNVPENFENQIPSRLHSVALNYVLLQKFLNILMK